MSLVAKIMWERGVFERAARHAADMRLERNEAQASLEAARAATKVALATAKDMARERDEAREVARQALVIAEANQEIAESLTRSLAYSDAALRIAEATHREPSVAEQRAVLAYATLNGVRLHDAVVEVTLNGHPWSHLDGLRKGRWTPGGMKVLPYTLTEARKELWTEVQS